jgi:hypothetical protein
MVIFEPKPSKFWNFWPSSQVIYPYRSFMGKNPGAEYLTLGPLYARKMLKHKIQERNSCTCHSSAEFSVEEEVEAVEAGPENI